MMPLRRRVIDLSLICDLTTLATKSSHRRRRPFSLGEHDCRQRGSNNNETHSCQKKFSPFPGVRRGRGQDAEGAAEVAEAGEEMALFVPRIPSPC